MKKYKILFADLDGTLIDTVSGETFPKGIWDMKFKFDVLDAIKNLAIECVFIVSNQGGIEKGFVLETNLRTKFEYICKSLMEYCQCKCYGLYCKSNDKNHPDRKPNTGVLEYYCDYFIDDNNFNKKYALMIGDASGKPGQWSDTDKKTAENFGIDYLDVNDFVELYKK